MANSINLNPSLNPLNSPLNLPLNPLNSSLNQPLNLPLNQLNSLLNPALNPPLPQIAQAKTGCICYSHIRQCFAYLSHTFNQSRINRFCQRCIYPYTSLVTNAIQVVVNLSNARIFNIFINIFQNTTTAIEERWIRSTLMLKIVRSTKILALTTLPFALFVIGKEICSCFTAPSKMDAIFRLLEGVTWLSDSLAASLNGLQILGVFQAVNWIFSLSLSSTLLSIALIILRGKELYSSQKMQFLMENSNNLLEDLLSYDNYALNKIFDVDAQKLRATLLNVQQQAENIQQQMIETLKNRIRIKNFCHRLAIISSLITLIGMAILFIPLISPGYGLLAVAATVSFIKVLYEKKSTNYLNKVLKCSLFSLSPVQS